MHVEAPWQSARIAPWPSTTFVGPEPSSVGDCEDTTSADGAQPALWAADALVPGSSPSLVWLCGPAWSSRPPLRSCPAQRRGCALAPPDDEALPQRHSSQAPRPSIPHVERAPQHVLAGPPPPRPLLQVVGHAAQRRLLPPLRLARRGDAVLEPRLQRLQLCP